MYYLKASNLLATQVGRFPWLGMFNYNPNNDPWKTREGPAAYVPARSYMHSCEWVGGWGEGAVHAQL